MRLPFQALFESRSGIVTKGFDSVSDLFGGGPTKSGVNVSDESVEGIPTVFACVRVISSALAQLPFKLYRREEGGKHEATDNPLYDVLHDMANPEMTSYELKYLLTSHLLLWGNAYAEIVRNSRGEVTALWPLMPWAMHVDRDDRRRLRFTYGERKWLYDPARPPVLRLMMNSRDGITGRSTASVLRESMGLTQALQDFGSTFFRNGSRYGGVLTTEQELDEDQEKGIRQVIEQLHAGTEKAHRVLILSNGFKFQTTGMPLEDLEFLASRKYQRSELCGAFGVPPHMIADLERSSVLRHTYCHCERTSTRSPGAPA